MERITLSQVPRYSFYVKRSLQAIDYGADDARMLAMLEERTKAPVTREMMVERLAGCETGEFLADAMRRLRRDVMRYDGARGLRRSRAHDVRLS